MKLDKIIIRLFSALLTAIIIFASAAPTAAAMNMDDVGAMIGPIAVQCAEAYKKAYQEAKESGVIDQINAFLDEAKSVFLQTGQWIDENRELLKSEEFEARLRRTAENAISTVRSIKELINNADELDGETLAYATDLLESLYVNVADLFELLRIASIDAGEYVSPEIEAIIERMEENISALRKDAAELIAELEAEASERIAAFTAEAEAKISALRLDAEERTQKLRELLATTEGKERDELLAELKRTEDKLAEDIAAVEKMLADETASVTAWLLESVEKVNERLQMNIDSIVVKLGEAIDELAQAVSEISELAKMNEAIGEAFGFIEDKINEIWSEAERYITETVEKYTSMQYSVQENSFFLAIGNDTAYAPMLANKLGLGSEQSLAVGWDQLTPEVIEKADLISIGFNENQMNGFAFDQMLGFVADYINEKLRGDFILYVEEAVSEFLSSAVPLLKPLLMKKVTELVTDSVNMGLDAFCEVQLGGNTATELDWAAVVGEEGVESIDALRETMRNEISQLGIEDIYAYEVSVVDLIYDNLENLEDVEEVAPEAIFLLKLIGRESFGELLGECATYTLNIPMSDALMFSCESYVYSYIQFAQNYSDTVMEISRLNPDAKVILLGHYNALGGIRFTMGDISVDVGSVYEKLAMVACATPFAHVFFMENAIYVDIFDAETVYGKRIAEGESNEILMFALSYMTDRTLTDLSERGHAYVCDQILRSMKEEVEEAPPTPPTTTPEEPQEPSKSTLVAAVTGTTAIVVIASYAVSSLVKRKKQPPDTPEADEE